MKNVPMRIPTAIAMNDQMQVAAAGDADQADRERRDLRVAHEPERARCRDTLPCRSPSGT